MKDRLIAAEDFNLLTDKSTDISNRAELSVFVRYVDSDTCDIKKEFLGMTEIVGNKGAEALFKAISGIFIQKGIPLSNMQFNGMNNTNTMGGETSGLQRRFIHAVPHSKYMNSRNHKLALAFLHTLKKKELKLLADVDALLPSL